DVADDANDRSPWVVIDRPLHPEPLSDRVFIRPVSARHRFIDNSDGRRVLAILFGEDSSSLQWDANRLKQIRSHNPIVNSSQRLIGYLLPFNKECPGKFDAAQGESVYCACRIHSGKCFEFFRKLPIEARGLCAECPP